MAGGMIEELKKDMRRVHRFTDERGDAYGIRVLGRGENLFFQKNERAFICEIDAVRGLINTKTITKWDDGKKMPADEKENVLKMVLLLYQKYYNDDAKLYP